MYKYITQFLLINAIFINERTNTHIKYTRTVLNIKFIHKTHTK